MAISDVLFESAQEIRRYLLEHPDWYDAPRLLKLLEEMDAIRVELDTPPTGNQGQRSAVLLAPGGGTGG